MDLTLNPEQEATRRAVREWVDAVVAPAAIQNDREERFPQEALDGLIRDGWIGLTIPEEYGGGGADPLSYCLVIEELGRGDANVRSILSVHLGLVAGSVLRWGTEEQKQQWLPKMATGDALGCFCLTEPDHGSDPATLESTAVREGDNYRLNGSKIFITNGDIAGVALVMARTGGPGARGVSAFLVPCDVDGFKPKPIHGKLGLRSCDTAEIALEDCVIPASALLGQEGDGIKVALSALDDGRMSLAASCTGLAQNALDVMTAYSLQREQFGKPIAGFQLIQELIADTAVEVEAARLLTWRVADLKARGESYNLAASMAKYYASEASVRAANAAVQVHGGYGYVDEFIVGKLLRDSRVTTLYEGTSQVQKLLIGRAVTGVSRVPLAAMAGPITRIALKEAKDPWEVASASKTYRRNLIRGNVGNLVYAQAVHRALSTSNTVVDANRNRVGDAEADRINEGYDAFVVPLANAFRVGHEPHLEALTDLIEKLRVPVVIVGVGAQALLDHDTSAIAYLQPVVKRFVRAVLNRSATIGVRGEFTADYLKSLGFNEVDVIGCPSMYRSRDPLDVRPTKHALTPEAKLSIGVSTYVPEMGPILTHHLATYRRLTYVAQDRETLGMLMTGIDGTDDDTQPQLPRHLAHQVFADAKVRFFLDPARWQQYLGGRDFYFGTRIHGTIVSLLAGTPACLLAHDSRTEELASFHRIPYRRIVGLDPSVDAADLYAEADFTPMYDAHAANFATYCRFLERNGLRHIWQPGESAAEFDAAMAAVTFPGPVRSVRAAD